MKNKSSWICAFVLTFAILAIPVVGRQTAVTGGETSGYHMRIVSRSTQAVDYHHND
jgi:hypothetical protein